MDFETGGKARSDSRQAIEDYLLARCADGDPAEIARALAIMARGAGIDGLSRRIGLTRQAVFAALSDDDAASIAIASRIADILGLRLNLVRKRSRT